ncbi:HEAT repeat domain-containing protein [Gimesia sp.]|uniref:HEAT repeat domain-containing protein n=1 Tax=Gimesia sp. TaxID=2024833 RepID=UPI003A93A410
MSVPAFRENYILIAVLFVLNSQLVLATDPPDIPELIGQLNDVVPQKRKSAAEKLAELIDPCIAPAVTNQIAKEKDFHVRLALHFALASQGNRKALQPLIDSLKKTGHSGSYYLRRATNEDFGWSINQWQEWFDSTSDEKYRQFIQHRWEQKPMMEAFSEFASLYSRRHFESSVAIDGNKKVQDFIKPLTKEERQKLKTLPTAKSWDLFEDALQQLQTQGNKKEAARLFHKVATEYPDTYYAEQSKELAELLDQMALEDREYKPPQNVKLQSVTEQISYHIYQLRNLVAYQFSQPGYPSIFGFPPLDDDETVYNPAVELCKIGDPAVPFLLRLLEDPRPIRAVSYWRNFVPVRQVLRYRDVAKVVLKKIRPDIADDLSRYDSTKDPIKKKLILERIKSTHSKK